MQPASLQAYAMARQRRHARRAPDASTLFAGHAAFRRRPMRLLARIAWLRQIFTAGRPPSHLLAASSAGGQRPRSLAHGRCHATRRARGRLLASR